MAEKLSDNVYGEYKIEMEYHTKLDGFRAIKFVFGEKKQNEYIYIQKLAQSGNLNAPKNLIIAQLKMDGLKEIHKKIDGGHFPSEGYIGSNFSDLKRINGEFFLKE